MPALPEKEASTDCRGTARVAHVGAARQGEGGDDRQERHLAHEISSSGYEARRPRAVGLEGGHGANAVA